MYPPLNKKEAIKIATGFPVFRDHSPRDLLSATRCFSTRCFLRLFFCKFILQAVLFSLIFLTLTFTLAFEEFLSQGLHLLFVAQIATIFVSHITVDGITGLSCHVGTRRKLHLTTLSALSDESSRIYERWWSFKLPENYEHGWYGKEFLHFQRNTNIT